MSKLEEFIKNDFIKKIDDAATIAIIKSGKLLFGTGCKQKPKTQFTCPGCGCKFGFKVELKT